MIYDVIWWLGQHGTGPALAAFVVALGAMVATDTRKARR